MRRTLFGKSPEHELPSAARASAREVLLFDVRDHETSNDATLAERRVSGWTFAPWLLLVGHLIITATLVIQGFGTVPAATLARSIAPLGGSLLLDAVAGLVMLGWRRMQLAPHTVTRLMCGYIGLTGVLWMASAGIGELNIRSGGFALLAVISGFFIRSIVSIVSPPLAISNSVVAVIATALFSPSGVGTFVVDALAVVMVVYSVAVTQESVAAGRRRLAVEWQAKKALNFVDEFENSGRGWFWETDSLGTLSYVSQQLAEDFHCDPEALLGRQFTDLLSVDHASESSEERKTLGFH